MTSVTGKALSAMSSPVTLKIQTRADLVNVIPRALGFHPGRDIVICGRDAPFIRVDIPQSLAEYGACAEGLAPAGPFFYDSGAYVVVYGSVNDFETVTEAFLSGALMPGVQIRDVCRVEDGRVYGPDDTVGERIIEHPTGSTKLDAVKVHASRETLVEKAMSVDTAQEGVDLALAAYLAGDGASAWCYLDRAWDLCSVPTEPMHNLQHALTNAVPPGEFNV